MLTNDFCPPLRIVFCRSPKPKESKKPVPWGARTAEETELALFGDPSTNREERWEPLDLAAAVPLGDDIQFRSFPSAPSIPASAFLDEALHTLLVVLVDEELLADADSLDWIADCGKNPGMSSGRHELLIVVPHEGLQDRWLEETQSRNLDRFQVVDFSKLGERAERVDWLALRILNDGLRLAAIGAGAPKNWKLQLFISHAKRDGLSLAKSLNKLMEDVDWLKGFYDARSLNSFRPWEEQLEEGVASSVLVALRTDIYDHRPYCKKEVLWAEQYGSPVVFVDARGSLVHAGSGLPFESAPCVRIPDGNLVRVLHAALRVAVRAQAFLRRVEELRKNKRLPDPPALRVISVTPGMSTVAAICESLEAQSISGVICYPEPRLPKGRLDAAEALAARAKSRLGTPGELLLSGGAS